MDTSAVEPLRQEHRALLPHIEALRATADLIGRMGLRASRPSLEASVEFLEHHLIPHAEAEDAALYPVVERVMGAAGATATMRRDHAEVRHLTDELAAVRHEVEAGEDTGDLASEARRLLYGLHAIVSLHFAKEEEIYVPLLERTLTPEEAADMFAAMDEATITLHHHA